MKVLKKKKKRPVFKFQQVCDILKIVDYKEDCCERKCGFFFLSELFEAGLTCLC